MTEDLAAAFAGRSVFVTGHTGFKGSWLSLWLADMGARVTGYALSPETEPSLFEVADVVRDLERHVVGDIRDRESVADALQQAAPDVVLHLAARTVVREGYMRPAETFAVNVDGTTALLDAVRTLDRDCAVVVVTSDKCYANDESGRPFIEDDRLGGRDPYSASKAAQEMVAQSYRCSFFDRTARDEGGPVRRLATGRAGNVIGGGDWTADGLVADLARARARREPTVLRHPSAVRPWQHVLEPLSGYLTLAAHLAGPAGDDVGSAYNFGPDPADDATVGQLVDSLLSAWDPESPREGRWRGEVSTGHAPEAGVLRLGIGRAATDLCWRPRWRLDEAVARTARWYRAYESDPDSARAGCLVDIRAYGRERGDP
ncbi:CDP-glucose 4,6-dehydratase [Geodermatophilus sabuli]|uniref:CDP-glucose 4,6-dehydratase n=1 Tax=Geodermatophilus sabuli TaxID=1564158 RepID=A0A285EHW5_9ACTN|nr:CDP-glucose 4,6-dehydratase [Geodermatophilus sabuli]MBB3086915.1 CDP-glucose 4,6-dehydratase [Geodermatophilus sabuli]SNX98712.1 CDP-glucose 4,6-dehydratase [Geodermatophilus sabuli]